MRRKQLKAITAASALAYSASMLPGSATAATLDLADAPLFFGEIVTPNIFFMVDDSGSMDWDILTGRYFHACGYDPDIGPYNNADGNCGGWRSDGGIRAHSGTEWKTYRYIFATPDDKYNHGCNADYPQAELCGAGDGPDAQDWRARSASVNVTYYDPTITYEPWPDKANASFTAARSNPMTGTDGFNDFRNLSGFFYQNWVDDKGFTGIRPRRGNNTNQTNIPNGIVDIWDTHHRVQINSSSATVTSYVYDNIDSIGSQVGLNPTISSPTNLSGGGCFVQLGDQSSPTACRTIAEAQQNIANWYQYARRRSLAVKGAIANVVDETPYYRYGLSLINDSNDVFVEVPDLETTTFDAHNDAMMDEMFSYEWQSQGTPLRIGLRTAGQYYDNVDGKTNPIIHTCQQNFTVLFSDGYWNGDDNPGVGNQDGDAHSETLADVAKWYYDHDLSPLANEVPTSTEDTADWQHMVTYAVSFGVTGLLSDGNDDGVPDADRDSVSPIQEDSNWGDPINNTTADRIDDMWHAAFNTTGEYISAKTPKEVADALKDALANIAERLSSASAVALNSASLSSGSALYQARFDTADWSGELISYQISDGKATSGRCAGLLFGDICGYPDDPVWEAGDVLDSTSWDSGREIITFNGNKGVPFRWPADESSPSADELSSALVAALNQDDGGSVDGLGEERLEFLRGKTDPQFRSEREHKLGDIVNSAPALVGPPTDIFPLQWTNLRHGTAMPENNVDYYAWRDANKNRDRVVYVAANDGMIHGFDAGTYTAPTMTDPASWSLGTGEEVIAYIPGLISEKLNRLTDPDYAHEFFADASLTFIDAFYNNNWHTVLSGGLAKGGQGAFALDITNPSSLSESNADDIVMWEFGDTDNPATAGAVNASGEVTGEVEGDPEVGYLYNQPINIVRMHDGKWYAVFGNGYNNTVSDGSASTTGNAVLFFVDIATGHLKRKISTGIGTAQDPLGLGRPNALATPAPVDIDGDFVVDFIYAGDMFGNLWKFDVTSPSKNSWSIQSTPLFTARDSSGDVQPITTRPQVGSPVGTQYLRNSIDNLMVYFGTGKYVELNDNTVEADEPDQSFYAIWDPMINSSTVSRSSLLKQSILKEKAQDTGWWRTTTNYNIPGKDSSGTDTSWWTNLSNPTTPDLRGWYIDLISPIASSPANQGERVVYDSLLRHDRIIFSTLIPSENPCAFGGDSWLMELDLDDGSRLTFSPFDVDGNRTFNTDDYIESGDVDDSGTAVPVPPSGTKSTDGIMTMPSILTDSDSGVEVKIYGDTSGNLNSLLEDSGSANQRQSWRHIQQ